MPPNSSRASPPRARRRSRRRGTWISETMPPIVTFALRKELEQQEHDRAGGQPRNTRARAHQSRAGERRLRDDVHRAPPCSAGATGAAGSNRLQAAEANSAVAAASDCHHLRTVVRHLQRTAGRARAACGRGTAAARRHQKMSTSSGANLRRSRNDRSVSLRFSLVRHCPEHDALELSTACSTRTGSRRSRRRRPTARSARRPPSSTRNSPINRSLPGRYDARQHHDGKMTEYTGMTRRPQPAEVRGSCGCGGARKMTPTRRNSAPVETPWLSMVIIEPAKPCEFIAIRPSIASHVAHRRVAPRADEVGLHHRDERAVDDADDREPRDVRRADGERVQGTTAWRSAGKP